MNPKSTMKMEKENLPVNIKFNGKTYQVAYTVRGGLIMTLYQDSVSTSLDIKVVK